MNKEELHKLLDSLVAGGITVNQALDKLEHLPYENLGYARLDHLRELRTGFPEVVFCQGKTLSQVGAIISRLAACNRPILGTRACVEAYEEVHKLLPEALYYEMARCIVVPALEEREKKGNILIVSAGTADMSVAEEAAVSAETMGLKVTRLYDVGVAGIHRLLKHTEKLQNTNVVIAVAGMEGLASVIGGLTSRPVIAVPTSIGYGANFGGLSALLSMLNSCASGVGVVNIDNGYGAAALAHAIVESGGV